MQVNWGNYGLVRRNRRAVVGIGFRFRFTAEEIEDIMYDIAVCMCFETGAGNRDRNFVHACKSEFKKKIRDERMTLAMSQIASGDSDDMTDGEILDSLGHVTKPDQENAVYYAQCVKVMDELPPNCMETMKKIACGYSPIEIAVEGKRDIRAVLDEIRISRDWMIDWAKFG